MTAMDQEITFAGLATVPSGHLAADGQLAMCVGFVPKGGELTPVLSAPASGLLPTGYEMVCRHVTPLGSRVIARRRAADGADLLYWCNENLSGPAHDADLFCIEEFGEVRDVAAFGQLLVIAADDGLTYAHWTSAGYAILDLRNLPVVEFGLQKAGALSMEKRYTVPSWMAVSTPTSGFGEGAWTTHPLTSVRATEAETATRLVYGDFKAAVSSQIEAAGCFHSPFFVRYALRLHDGSHLMPSPPVLMLPSLLPPMLKASAIASADGDEAVMTIDASSMCFYSLRCRVSDYLPKSLGPYVTAIDIFVTESVPTYSATASPGGIVSYASIVRNRNLYGADLRGRATSGPVFAGQWSEGGDDYSDRYVSESELSKSVWNMAPNLSMTSSLLSLKDFHLAGSIPVSEALSDAGFRSIDVCDTSAEAIAALPRLEADESDLARRIRPDVIWSDGGRVVAGGGELALHKPWPMAGSVSFCGNRLDPAYLPVTVTAYSRSLADDGVSTTVTSSAISPRYSLADTFPHFLYVPDSGVYRLEVRQGGNSWALPMRRHPSLPGAFWLGDLEYSRPPEAEVLPDLFTPDTLPAKAANMVCEAASGNPFRFDAQTRVGEGAVRFFAPAFRSMSSGQFGQYPLYVFSESGIWALPADGSGRAVRISADVARSVAVSGASVAYSTDRAVHLLKGNQSECVSDAMLGAGDPWLSGSAEARGLLEAEGLEVPAFADVVSTGSLEYGDDPSMLYLRSGDAAFACCVTDKSWGVVSEGSKGFILTRPVKLNSASARKRITAVSLTGPLSLRGTKIAVLGSDDLRHWRLLGSACGTAVTAMRGTGARYVAVAAVTVLNEGQTISGCTFFY